MLFVKRGRNSKMKKIKYVEPLDGFRLRLEYTDGVEGIVDVSHLAGRGVFAAWNDYEFFKIVRVGPNGDVRWDNDIDLCPDALYLKIAGKSPEQLFPQLRNESIDA